MKKENIEKIKKRANIYNIATLTFGGLSILSGLMALSSLMSSSGSASEAQKEAARVTGTVTTNLLALNLVLFVVSSLFSTVMACYLASKGIKNSRTFIAAMIMFVIIIGITLFVLIA